MAAVTERALAKINLTLLVKGRRADGYHELSSVVAFADVGDELDVHVADQNALKVEGAFAADVPADQSNIIWKAYHWLAQRRAVPCVRLKLTKNLPVASGIGGGSADAAAMLHALLRLTGEVLNEDETITLARDLGADVPVCFRGKPCLMEGIGEKVSILTEQLPEALVLVNPLVPCLTADVFKAMGLAPGEMRPVPPQARWQNDMTAAAIRVQPKIAEVLSALHKTPAFPVLMSGSGATCFGVARDLSQAEMIAADVQKRHPHWWVRPARLLT